MLEQFTDKSQAPASIPAEKRIKRPDRNKLRTQQEEVNKKIHYLIKQIKVLRQKQQEIKKSTQLKNKKKFSELKRLQNQNNLLHEDIKKVKQKMDQAQNSIKTQNGEIKRNKDKIGKFKSASQIDQHINNLN